MASYKKGSNKYKPSVHNDYVKCSSDKVSVQTLRPVPAQAIPRAKAAPYRT